jgi:hypothetical protein
MKPPATNDCKDAEACCWLLSAKPVPKIRLNAIKSPDARRKSKCQRFGDDSQCRENGALNSARLGVSKKLERRDRKEKNFCADVPVRNDHSSIRKISGRRAANKLIV